MSTICDSIDRPCGPPPVLLVLPALAYAKALALLCTKGLAPYAHAAVGWVYTVTREACTVRTQKVLTSDAWTSATSQVPDMTMPDGATRDRDLVTHLMAYNAANMANAVQPVTCSTGAPPRANLRSL
eukprot:250796-Pyramimonas_sp.AAC.1